MSKEGRHDRNRDQSLGVSLGDLLVSKEVGNVSAEEMGDRLKDDIGNKKSADSKKPEQPKKAPEESLKPEDKKTITSKEIKELTPHQRKVFLELKALLYEMADNGLFDEFYFSDQEDDQKIEKPVSFAIEEYLDLYMAHPAGQDQKDAEDWLAGIEKILMEENAKHVFDDNGVEAQEQGIINVDGLGPYEDIGHWLANTAKEVDNLLEDKRVRESEKARRQAKQAAWSRAIEERKLKLAEHRGDLFRQLKEWTVEKILLDELDGEKADDILLIFQQNPPSLAEKTLVEWIERVRAQAGDEKRSTKAKLINIDDYIDPGQLKANRRLEKIKMIARNGGGKVKQPDHGEISWTEKIRSLDSLEDLADFVSQYSKSDKRGREDLSQIKEIIKAKGDNEVDGPAFDQFVYQYLGRINDPVVKERALELASSIAEEKYRKDDSSIFDRSREIEDKINQASDLLEVIEVLEQNKNIFPDQINYQRVVSGIKRLAKLVEVNKTDDEEFEKEVEKITGQIDNDLLAQKVKDLMALKLEALPSKPAEEDELARMETEDREWEKNREVALKELARVKNPDKFFRWLDKFKQCYSDKNLEIGRRLTEILSMEGELAPDLASEARLLAKEFTVLEIADKAQELIEKRVDRPFDFRARLGEVKGVMDLQEFLSNLPDKNKAELPNLDGDLKLINQFIKENDGSDLDQFHESIFTYLNNLKTIDIRRKAVDLAIDFLNKNKYAYPIGKNKPEVRQSVAKIKADQETMMEGIGDITRLQDIPQFLVDAINKNPDNSADLRHDLELVNSFVGQNDGKDLELFKQSIDDYLVKIKIEPVRERAIMLAEGFLKREVSKEPESKSESEVPRKLDKEELEKLAKLKVRLSEFQAARARLDDYDLETEADKEVRVPGETDGSVEYLSVTEAVIYLDEQIDELTKQIDSLQGLSTLNAEIDQMQREAARSFNVNEVTRPALENYNKRLGEKAKESAWAAFKRETPKSFGRWNFWKERLKGVMSFGLYDIYQAEKIRRSTRNVAKIVSDDLKVLNIFNRPEESLKPAEKKINEKVRNQAALDAEKLLGVQLKDISAEEKAEVLERALLWGRAEHQHNIEEQMIEKSLREFDSWLVNDKSAKLRKIFGLTKTANGELAWTEQKKLDLISELRMEAAKTRLNRDLTEYQDFVKVMRKNIDPNYWTRYVYGGMEMALASVGYVYALPAIKTGIMNIFASKPAEAVTVKTVAGSGAKSVTVGAKSSLIDPNLLSNWLEKPLSWISKATGASQEFIHEIAPGINLEGTPGQIEMKKTVWNTMKVWLENNGVPHPTNAQILEATKAVCSDPVNNIGIKEFGTTGKVLDVNMQNGFPLSIKGLPAKLATKAAFKGVTWGIKQIIGAGF